MFTVCPKCALTLVVTAADLRVAQGYVRCGRCLNVFNALARLSEDRAAAPPEPPPDTTAAGSPKQAEQAEQPEQATSPEPPAPSSTADDTGEIEIELDASVVVTSARAPAALEETGEHEAPVDGPSAAAAVPETSQPAPAATAITETRAPPTSAAPGHARRDDAGARSAPSPAIANAQAPGNSRVDEPSPQAPLDSTEQPARAESSSSAEASDAQPTNTPQQQPDGSFELETRRPRAGLAWKLGTGALAIALALQLVNHYRDSLAATPALRGPLSAVYSALGVKLAPRWDIHAYDVRQLGASVAGAAAGEIVVRASVKNSASRAQPLPLLRVTLQDRFGNRIAARDVPPGNYLPSSVAPGSLLAAGGRVDATMVFVDPGPQAVGFEIDACLRQRSGAVACAHGP